MIFINSLTSNWNENNGHTNNTNNDIINNNNNNKLLSTNNNVDFERTIFVCMNVSKQYLIIFNAVNLAYKRQLEGITINLIVTFSKTLRLFSRYIRISTCTNHYYKKNTRSR